jgi:hypothetical protein
MPELDNLLKWGVIIGAALCTLLSGGTLVKVSRGPIRAEVPDLNGALDGMKDEIKESLRDMEHRLGQRLDGLRSELAEERRRIDILMRGGRGWFRS